MSKYASEEVSRLGEDDTMACKADRCRVEI